MDTPVSIIKTKRINDISKFSKVVFNNFSYLTEYPELQHNIDGIVDALSRDNIILLLYLDKKLIGYLIGDFRELFNKIIFYISYVFIMEKYRGKGLGKKLMDIIISEAKARNVDTIILTCDSRDHKVMNFYKKYGFDILKDVLVHESIHKVLRLLIV